MFRKVTPAKTLYVHRPIVNGQDIVDWFKGQGFETTLPADDLHVTIAFSKDKLVWDDVDPMDSFDEMHIAPDEDRKMDRFGEASVLRFEDKDLESRWQEFKDAGAKWSHDGYKPHITISWEADKDPEFKPEPYTGKIVLGPEVWEEIDEDWQDGVVEKAKRRIKRPTRPTLGGKGKYDESKHPRGPGGKFKAKPGKFKDVGRDPDPITISYQMRLKSINSPLTDLEKKAMLDYSHHKYYRHLNNKLRFGRYANKADLKRMDVHPDHHDELLKLAQDSKYKQRLSAIQKNLDSAIAKATIQTKGDPWFARNGVKDGIIGYRGLSASGFKEISKHKVGSTFTDPAFISTTMRKGMSSYFMNEGGGRLTIQIPLGSKGLILGGNSHFSGGMELVLPRNTRFGIISKSKDEIVLQVVGDDMQKRGARHTTAEYKMLQEMHDRCVALGAHCSDEGSDSADDMIEVAGATNDMGKFIKANVCKVDESLGLVIGWAIVCKHNGEDYYDVQGDHIPEQSMLKATTEFMLGSRTAKAMHAGDPIGTIVFAFPLTTDIAKSLGLSTSTTGWMVAMKPDAAVLAKYKSGEYTGFSIGGQRVKDLEVA